jgi:hypothetical protein
MICGYAVPSAAYPGHPCAIFSIGDVDQSMTGLVSEIRLAKHQLLTTLASRHAFQVQLTFAGRTIGKWVYQQTALMRDLEIACITSHG